MRLQEVRGDALLAHLDEPRLSMMAFLDKSSKKLAPAIRASLADRREHPNIGKSPWLTMPAMDSKQLREATGRCITGVGVITTAGAGGKQGALVNNVACVSMEPPVYLACFGNSSNTLAGILESRCFNIHFLARGQQDIAMTFASKLPDKFSTVRHETGTRGAPVLAGALVCMECELESTVVLGESTILIGRVVEVHASGQEPLAMRGRDFVTIAPAP